VDEVGYQGCVLLSGHHEVKNFSHYHDILSSHMGQLWTKPSETVSKIHPSSLSCFA
jgi:hypothetical protein